MYYVCADLHLGHSNIIKYCDRFFCLTDFERDTIESIKEQCPNDHNALREFKISQESLDRMDQIIIDKINAMVQPNDTFYIPGDFSFVKKDFNLVRKYRERMNCKHIHFIRGNHDYFTDREYRTVFEFVGYYEEINFNKTKFIISHWPMISWNGSYHGSIMLHGHCHSNINNWKDMHMPGLPLIDVGFDEWDGPVSFDDLILEANRLKALVPEAKYPDMP